MNHVTLIDKNEFTACLTRLPITKWIMSLRKTFKTQIVVDSQKIFSKVVQFLHMHNITQMCLPITQSSTSLTLIYSQLLMYFTYNWPISSAVISPKRSIVAFLASSLPTTSSDSQWNCFNGCSNDHIRWYKDFESASNLAAVLDHPLWRAISNKPRVMRLAFWATYAWSETREKLSTIPRAM